MMGYMDLISAIILAAGRSTRMGRPKMLLPWGETTILGKVIWTIQQAGLSRIIVVTGGDRENVEKLVKSMDVELVFNENYENGEMLSSLQCGLNHLARSTFGKEQQPCTEAALICLGDQPQIKSNVVLSVIQEYSKPGIGLVVPSINFHRGHPWLISSRYWEEILKLRRPNTPRDFLNAHSEDIRYIEFDDSSLLADVDTIDDYLKFKP